MNTLNSSNDDAQECPLCLEPLEVDDLNFYPCTCGYQICRFCWHRIRTGENELCPACRKAYPENPADFTPLSQEQIAALKAEKRQRDQQKKQKVTENRKHLANVRVVQKNLVFVVGLPPRLADADILKKHEYFGKYGKIHKVVINPSTTYAGVQGPSASAYVTYLHNNDSLRAIQSVNNIMIDGRLIKTSLGTTKYCSHFMKNQQCPKPDCMYLHELGDPEASFTKEEMHQGKHQEYEKRLHDTLIAATANGVGGGSSLGVGLGVSSEKIHNSNSSSSGNEKGGGADSSKLSSKQQNGNIQSKDAWPSLSESPVSREMRPTKNGKDKDRNENRKHEKTKSEKARNKKEHKNNHNTGAHNSLEKTKDHQSNGKLSTAMSSSSAQSSSLNNKQTETHIRDDETHLIDDIEQDALSDDAHVNDGRQKRGLENTPSLSSSSSPSSASESSESGTLSETPSRVNSPGSFPDHPMQNAHHNERLHNHLKNHLISARQVQLENNSNIEPEIQDEEVGNIATNDSDNHKINISSSSPKLLLKDANVSDPSVRFSKLNLFDDNNSFFSSASYQPFLNSLGENNQTTNSPQLPDLLNGTESDKDRSEREDSKMNIFKGLSGYHSQQLNDKFGSSTFNTTEEWEAAFKYMMMRTTNNKQQHQMDAQEELMRSHEFQKRNNIINSLAGVNHYSNNGPNDYNFDYDFCRAATMLHQQQQQQQPQQRPLNSQMHLGENIGQGHVYPSNMSKFFDFHKSQQQQFIMNSHNPSEHLNMGSNGIENNRVQQQQTQFIDQSSGFNGIQMPQHKRLVNKIEPYGSGVGNNHASMIPQNRIPNQFQSDDDLGFDPFVEGQKALAELMENEMVQQQSQPNNSFERTRMPPPGFNHMNAFGFGVPRAQGSKILPFMNSQGNWNQAVPQNPPQHQHMGFQQQQPPPQQNNDHNLGNNKNFSGSMADWTMYDPAIVSFRQFPQFLSGSGNGGAGVPPPQQQQQPADIFMGPLPPPHITQQQQHQQQGGQGFGPHGMNLSNSIINPQQNSPAQVNYSHTNWLNADQNIFMNNLTNGFSNNYDKFSIPMPPGFQANVGASSKQQKAECIN